MWGFRMGNWSAESNWWVDWNCRLTSIFFGISLCRFSWIQLYHGNPTLWPWLSEPLNSQSPSCTLPRCSGPADIGAHADDLYTLYVGLPLNWSTSFSSYQMQMSSSIFPHSWPTYISYQSSTGPTKFRVIVLPIKTFMVWDTGICWLVILYEPPLMQHMSHWPCFIKLLPWGRLGGYQLEIGPSW